MEIAAALAADLAILTAALDEPGTDVADSLCQLTANATVAVPTFLGLSVTVHGNDLPFTFITWLEGVGMADVRTSLRLTLPGAADAGLLPPVANRPVCRVAGNVCRHRRGSRVAHRPAPE